MGADRLACRCARPDCPAGTTPVPSPVVMHVVASLDGSAPAPGSMIGADALIRAELVADLAKSAKLTPLVHPADVAPEAGYTPSQALADFVRCRDLTCRFPGCDRPAIDCDIDHASRTPTAGRRMPGEHKPDRFCWPLRVGRLGPDF